MISRIALLPIAVVAALALSAPDAFAGGHHHGRRPVVHHRSHGHVFVGGQVAIPVGHRGGYYREVVEWIPGHYETRTRRVEVPGTQIGYDFHGRPIYSESRWEVQTYQVWIPRERVVRRVWVPGRAGGIITIGGRVRLH